MPEPHAPEIRGFPAGEGLWRLRTHLGHGGPLRPFLERHAPFDPPETLPEALGDACPSRLAQVEAADLPHLPLPALAQLREGTWLLLHARSGRSFRVEGPLGATSMDFATFLQTASGRVLERILPLGRGSLGQRLRSLMAPFRPQWVQVIAATLVAQALGLAGPCLTRATLNRALPDGAGSMLVLVSAGGVLVAAHQAWLGWFRGRLLLFMVNRMDAAAERGFLQHILGLPFPFLQGRPLGELLQAFGTLGSARELLVEKSLGTLLDASMAILLLSAMAWTLPGLTLGVAGAAFVIALLTLAAGCQEVRLQREGISLQVRERGRLHETLAGIATLKAAGAEGGALERWCRLARCLRRLERRQGRLRLWADGAAGLVNQALTAGLLLWGGHRVLKGEVSLGALFAFLQWSAAFMGMVLNLVDTCLSAAILAPQLAQARSLLDQETEPPPPRRGGSRLGGPILMEGVGFRYGPETPWILSDFDLRVEPGARHQLRGPSGSGKSTILRLLAGLWSPERGRILLGGRDPRGARDSLLYLPQFVQIMGGTILENLRILSGGASLEALLRAGRRTGLDELAASLPLGYQTPLPHGGGTLSGGQRQWIAITAALASERPLLLLDEATANLDAQRTDRIREALLEGPWTLIAASHTPLVG